MNRQPPRRSVLYMLLSILTRKAPEQAKQHIDSPRRPAPDDSGAWDAYWKALGQPWRAEPEIDLKRQAELAQRRAIVPDIKKGNYPFKGIKLSRADVEWLLATHEDGRGPVDWSDERQRNRKGLDLRGTDLRQVDLRGLPLACMRGGLTLDEVDGLFSAEPERYKTAAIHLEDACLWYAHLEGAILNGAHLERVLLSHAHMENALLGWVHLEDGALIGTDLKNAYLLEAHLEGSRMDGAKLEEARLSGAHLEGAALWGAFFNRSTRLDSIVLSNKEYGGASLSDVHWGEVNIAQIDWPVVKMLGEEREARKKRYDIEQWYAGEITHRRWQLFKYQWAVRANRQISILLQSQGLNQDAVRFAYRAPVLQKKVLWFQMTMREAKFIQRIQLLGAWLFSWFLFLLAGYGYKPGRSFLAYLLVIGTFMALYLHLDPHLSWYEAIVVSMTAFHGRGFSPSTFSPGDPLSIASAVEAFVGLIIEVTFIATLTRRFFGQ